MKSILQPVFLTDLHTLRPARKQLPAPVGRYLFTGLQEADEFSSVLVG